MNVLDVQPSHFLGIPELGSKVLVRTCYTQLAQLILDTPERRILLTGTPGIGRSRFSFFVMHFLRQRNHDVKVVLQRERDKVYLFKADGVFIYGRYTGIDVLRREYLDDPDVWYIVDSDQPALGILAKTLLVSSPSKERCKEFRREGALVLYMPVWSWTEIQQWRSYAYATLPEERVSFLYSRWGGIPRYVLERANNQAEQDELDAAIAGASASHLLDHLSGAQGPDHPSHNLIHLIPKPDSDPPFTSFTFATASDYVANQLTKRFGLLDEHISLLQGLQRRTGYEILFGHLYESFAHEVICRGGHFHVRKLEEGASTKIFILRLQPKNLVQLSSIADIATITAAEYGAGHNTFPAIDAVTCNPNALFNVTATNNVNRGATEHIVNVIDQLPATFAEPCPFYWVVPKERFKDFPRQTCTTVPHLHTLITQHVMEVPIAVPTGPKIQTMW